MSYTQIYDEERYNAVVAARIRARSRGSKSDRWHAADPTRKDLVEWLQEQRGDFLRKMADSYGEWGTLTEGQEDAVRRIRDEAAGRRAARVTEDLKSGFVGTVGKREVFAGLSIVSVFENDGQYGTTYAHKFVDRGGNVLHWRTGRKVGERGDVVTLKATVKDHYTGKSGVKSTILTRATVEETAAPALVEKAPAKARSRLVELAVQAQTYAV